MSEQRDTADDEYEDDEPNLARCDYYQDCGICTFGCWEEPACITNGPWTDPLFTAAEANSIAIRRYAYRMQRWLAWQFTKAWMASTDTGSSDSP